MSEQDPDPGASEIEKPDIVASKSRTLEEGDPVGGPGDSTEATSPDALGRSPGLADVPGGVKPAGPPYVIRDLINHLSPSVWGPSVKTPRLPGWPPDLFAIVASILEKSGAYTSVVGHWPPPDWSDHLDRHDNELTWADWIQAVGDEWRNHWPGAPPQVLGVWWEQLVSHADTEIVAVVDQVGLCHVLLQLLAVADEACLGIGTAFFDEEALEEEIEGDQVGDKLWEHALELLNCKHREGTTLCESIHPSRVRVLPKSRTPNSGMTLRSLSLYLALCPGAEVSIEWYLAGWKREVERYLNLLLVPWPERVLPSDFRELKRDVETPTDPSYRMFAFDPDRAPLEGGGGRAADRVTTVVDLIARAKQIVGKVDGVVLPECALSQEDYDAIWARIAGERCLLIAGVRCREPNQFCGNRVETRFNVGATPVSLRQAKHHRWKLDKDQIRTYGLASQLHPDTVWWEGIELCRRELKFVALQPWLTVCSLICEDLARQEPMAEIIRSVGPSLVIALLMDGPQLETRWPSRYATVLADDPGSSVLTLSSIGMVGLSRPLGGYTPCRTIALWKDALSAKSVQIDLPGDAQGVVISLVNTENLEQAADGRYDEEPDKTLILGGIHPVKV